MPKHNFQTITMEPTLHKKMVELVVKAGQEALRIRRDGELTVDTKPDGSDITNGDKASNAILMEGLTRLFPHKAIISEEEKKSSPHGKYSSGWVIDPIDGTTSYKNKRPEFGVLAAWVENGVPIHGFAYFPDPQYGTIYFTGPHGKNAFKQKVKVSSDGAIEFGNAIELKTRPATSKPTVAEVYTDVSDFFPGDYSAVKDPTARNTVAMIEGRVDLLAGPHTMADWDLAAMDAIARQEGAAFVSIKNKKPLTYGNERTAERAYMQERYVAGNVETMKRLGLMSGVEMSAGNRKL